MAKPKKKQTKTRKRNRRAHYSIDAKKLATCEKCGAKVLPHHACPKCGNYKGRSVFEKVYDRVVSAVTKKADTAEVKEAPKAEVKEEKKAEEPKKEAPKAKATEKKEKVAKDDAEKSAK